MRANRSFERRIGEAAAASLELLRPLPTLSRNVFIGFDDQDTERLVCRFCEVEEKIDEALNGLQ